jgi:ATP-binding cassette subfamily B protein
MMIVMNFAVIAVIYIGGFEAAAQRMKPGTIMAAVTYLTQIFHSVMMLNNIFQTISRSSASAKRVVEVLETDPIIKSGELESGDPENEYSIEFNDVDFRYPSAVGRPVLEGINLKITRGETLAIIGATGSGKSSLVKLIPRFYDANSGSVFVDGRDVREYDLTALRKKIGFVMQKSELFSDTILNNIKWGREDASDEEVARAAKLAEADGFITSFSDGYNTFVAEKGASLSGGQKQRISIARALVRHPEILILDDSTSALDLATEGKVRRALKEEFKDSTVLMIAQRIASVKDADRIAVIDGGRIVACDTHERLLEYCNEYQEIYSSQMKSGAYIEAAVSSGADIEGGVVNE